MEIEEMTVYNIHACGKQGILIIIEKSSFHRLTKGEGPQLNVCQDEK